MVSTDPRKLRATGGLPMSPDALDERRQTLSHRIIRSAERRSFLPETGRSSPSIIVASSSDLSGQQRFEVCRWTKGEIAVRRWCGGERERHPSAFGHFFGRP
jgi:hypothetical protein